MNTERELVVEGTRGRVSQTLFVETPRGRIVSIDTAYDVAEANRGRDVVVNASYNGVLPARFIGAHAPRGAIGVDCAIGKDGAGIAGLWYLEALGIPAAAADVATVELGQGADMYRTAVVSVVNAPAKACGVERGMSVREAARLLLDVTADEQAPSEVTNRKVVAETPSGLRIVCTDSIAFALAEDTGRSVLCTAGHSGVPSIGYLRRIKPIGFIGSDGGRGKNDAGIACLGPIGEDGLAVAAVDARTARMGDGQSTYYDGAISACNQPAEQAGVEVGQPAREAARLMLEAADARLGDSGGHE
jgi:uncharacterized protein YunC (DUF1805 family)